MAFTCSQQPVCSPVPGQARALTGTVSSSCSNCPRYCPQCPPFLTEGEWHLCQAQQVTHSPFWAGVTKASINQTHRGPGNVIFSPCWGSQWLAQLPLQKQTWPRQTNIRSRRKLSQLLCYCFPINSEVQHHFLCCCWPSQAPSPTAWSLATAVFIISASLFIAE